MRIVYCFQILKSRNTWEKARKPLSNGEKWADYLLRYHVTDQISEQVSDFRFGPFLNWEKTVKWLFLTIKMLFLILYGAFSHLMYLKNSSSAKVEAVHHKMYKTILVHCCDVVPNLVMDNGIFNFCLLVCFYLRFFQLCKKMVELWLKKTVQKSGLWRGQ